ncbi:hypothetical protein E4U41_007382, partial [Claviceps citrina]
MLFSEEDAPLLKAWIVKRIENTSDADADVLAEYVIALLKHDGDKTSVRMLCEQEIPDFLTEDPKQFLDDVFQAITYRSFLPGAPPPPPPPPTNKPAIEPAAAPTNDETSKKRRFDETGPQNDHDRRGSHGRAVKLARRGRRGGRAEDRLGHGQFQGQQYPMGIAMPAFDPNNPMEALMSMQAMGMGFPMMGDGSGWFGAAAAAAAAAASAAATRGGGGGGGGQKRRRCRDFDSKGYCSRGSTCVFDHGGEEGLMNQEEYDPGNAMILPFPSSDMDMDMDRGRGRGGGGSGRRGKPRGGHSGGTRAPFSAEGPVSDRSKTAIVVENIPEDSFSEDKVRGFFSQFGDIVQVSMQPYKHLAIVRFSTWASANDAYRSPKVIFDNRFVKVFWLKDESPPSIPGGEGDSGSGSGKTKKQQTGGDGGMGTDDMDITITTTAATAAASEMDMQEFRQKQEEAQKLHQQRQDKKTELQKQRELLQRQQQELLAKHRTETERLRAKLAEKSGGGGGGGEAHPPSLSSSSAD